MAKRDSTKLDIVLLSVPRIAPVRPQMAMGVLKGICNELDLTSLVLDINQDFYLKWGKTNSDTVEKLDDYFIEFSKPLPDDVKEQYYEWLDQWVDTIVKKNPNHIGISVFSWQSQRFTRDLLTRLRPKTSAVIHVGGQGLVHNQDLSAHWANKVTFAWELLDNNLIDYFMKGESEETFKRYMLGDRTLPGLNNDSVVKFSDLDTVALPDYTDLDVTDYQNGYEKGVLPIESSRGCVRSCSFCEMSSEHGKYRGKSGVSIAEEMIAYYDLYGVKDFYFHDDLMNGNLKDLNDMVDHLLDYYDKNALGDAYFSFSGYWIIRSEKNFNSDRWKRLKKAGANLFVVGIETGSDRLRKTVRKGFTNKDLEFSIEQLKENKLKFYFMLISGIPGETEQDFQDTLDMLTRWQKYVATGTIIGINLGTTATIEQGTDLYNNPDKYKVIGINNESPQGINWMSTETPELDYRERVRRRLKIQEHVIELGYPLWKGDDHLKIVMDQYMLNKDDWELYQSGLIM